MNTIKKRHLPVFTEVDTIDGTRYELWITWLSGNKNEIVIYRRKQGDKPFKELGRLTDTGDGKDMELVVS